MVRVRVRVITHVCGWTDVLLILWVRVLMIAHVSDWTDVLPVVRVWVCAGDSTVVWNWAAHVPVEAQVYGRNEVVLNVNGLTV